MEDVSETLGPRDFSRLLERRFGLRMSHQAVSKAAYLPRTAHGRIVVNDALVMLADRGRIQLDGDRQKSLPIDQAPAPDEQLRGRPKAGGNAYYDELTLTERVKRRKLEMEVAERECKLIRIEDVAEALVVGARRIGERLERLASLADDLVSAAHAGGAPAVRDLLRREIRAMRESLSEALSLAAAEDHEDEQG